MKKIVQIITFVLVCFYLVNTHNSVTLINAVYTQNESDLVYVDIPDEVLLRAINNQLGKGQVTTKITKKEMEKLTSLNYYHLNASDLTVPRITDLTGLEHAVNLVNLDLFNNSISDISPLQNLVQLENLDLHGNNIADISSLKGLTSLKILGLDSNQIDNISPLENLLNLEYLNLQGNKINNITALKNLRNLKKLYLAYNQIMDITPLKDLSVSTQIDASSQSLTIIFDELPISMMIEVDNPLRDINGKEIIPSSLAYHGTASNGKLKWHFTDHQPSGIEYLCLSNFFESNWYSGRLDIIFDDKVIQLSPYMAQRINYSLDRNGYTIITNSQLKKIEKLYLSKFEYLFEFGNEDDLQVIGEMTNLQVLDLSNNGQYGFDFTKLEDVWKRLPNLKELYLQNNNIEDISVLSANTKLEKLNLDGNNISDISVIKGYKNLKELNLNENKIKDIGPLENLSKLEHLSLKDNLIEDISPLSSLDGLIYLGINNNKINSLEPLTNARNLKTLEASNNKINSLEPLTNSKNLEVLWIGNNKIVDIKCLNNLVKLNSIILDGNDIANINLKNFPDLTWLSLSNNNIKDIQLDNPLKNLEVLALDGNKIENVKWLKNLNKVKSIYLDNNLISSLEGIGKLPYLKEFSLSYNKISNVSPLKVLDNLSYLYLDNNSIADLTPLASLFPNSSIVSGDKVIQVFNQTILLSEMKATNGIVEINNPLRNIDGWIIEPHQFSHGGKIKDYYTLSWNNIKSETNLTADFNINLSYGSGFSGTIIQPVVTQNKVPIVKIIDFKINQTDLILGDTAIFTALSDSNQAVYEFYVQEQGEWIRKQDYSSKNTFNYQPLEEGTYKVRVRVKHKDSTKNYDDLKELVFNVKTTTKADHVKRVSYFRAENGQLYIDGYSYVKGVNIPNKSDIIQKLKFVDVNTGKQVKTYELPNFYSTAASKDPNHGAGVYNYDWAKFKGYLDVSDLPVGDYYIKIYTNAKKNAYDEIIDFHSSIGDFNFITNGKEFKFVREGNTLRLSVEAVQTEQPTPPVTQENPHVKRVSYFRAENGQLYLDGYSYVKGINIPNQSDIIQKLKFVNVNTGKQVKTYELPNFYSTAASKDPNHGAGIYNYDWAKFKGYLDVSDLPSGEYYLKIYTNAKKNAYDEIIAFHSSIGDFSFESSGKIFNFERLDVNGVGTLKLVVSEITTMEEDETMTIVDEEIQLEIEQPGEDFNSDIENEIESLEVNEQASDIESDLNHI